MCESHDSHDDWATPRLEIKEVHISEDGLKLTILTFDNPISLIMRVPESAVVINLEDKVYQPCNYRFHNSEL